jgi:hypothetical protein
MYPAGATDWLVKFTNRCEQAGELVLKFGIGAANIEMPCETVFVQPEVLVMVKLTL